ncbi:MAG: exodeoxyribonuclease VII large subunit [Salinivirgaceae bacterium]|nr:exodeoxyribonuclease VII large subunit [Salinivirgaceae bacterium]
MTAPISLFELLNNVKTELKTAFQTPVWVVAEIIELNQNRMGHCYLELAEKYPDSDRMIAKTKATIWAGVYARLAPYFESVTGEQLRVGMKVLVRVTVEMHELYSFSLNVLDIDAQYTLGDIAQQRAKIIAQLTADGVIDMNKQLELPLVVQRIAVISSDSAAGWGDFKNQLDDNDYGYKFETELFMALMQGDGAPASIIAALNAIFNRIDDFDAVAILRGGGSKSDLSCFDNYELAYNAAQFPLPIITGIGHERDDSVLDLVANTRLKTPTALAAFIIDRAVDFEHYIDEKCSAAIAAAAEIIDDNIHRIENSQHRLVLAVRATVGRCQEQLSNTNIMVHNAVRRYFDLRTAQIASFEQKIKLLPQIRMAAGQSNLAHLEQRLKTSLNTFLEAKQRQLERFELVSRQADPQNVLKRGYSIVRSKGKAVTSPEQVKAGESLSIQTAGGEINSVVS